MREASAARPAPATTGVFSLLADGRSIRLRAGGEADRAELLALHARASDRSIYRRFFTASRAAAEAFVDVICTPSADVWSVVAEHEGQVVGVCTAMVLDRESAEVAVLVDDSLQGKGVATALLEQLRCDARRRGLSSFVAQVLTDNLPMLRVLHDAGFTLHEHRDCEVVSLTMDLTVSPGAAAASAWRQRRAQRLSLTPLFEPRSVAVIGVGRRRGRAGREALENILASGFVGPVHAVGHPDLRVPGVSCVPEVQQLPSAVDLVVVAVPAAHVEDSVRLAAERGARCCVVLASPRGDEGSDHAAAERRLTRIARIAREHDMRLVGPDSLGVSSSLRGRTVVATFAVTRPRAGTVALASQSRGPGVALMDAAHVRDLGLACFVSLGDMADVSAEDLLAAWTDDTGVGAAALYLESIRDPRRFARTAASFSREKPLLVLSGGASMAGARAGASRTAAGAVPERVLHALFRAAGAVDVEGVQELVDAAALLTEQPLPQGPRLGILGNAKGLGIVAADSASRRSLEVPDLGPVSRSQLTTAVPGADAVANPVDLGVSAGAHSFAEAARVLLASGEVDALITLVATTAVTDVAGIGTAVDAATAGASIPCLSVFIGTDTTPCHTTRFGSVEAATTALSHAVRYSTWRAAADLRDPVTTEDTMDGTWPGAETGAGSGRW